MRHHLYYAHFLGGSVRKGKDDDAIIFTFPDWAAQKMGVKPRLSLTSRSALCFTKIPFAWAWAAPDFYTGVELNINDNYGLNIELLHAKKACIITC